MVSRYTYAQNNYAKLICLSHCDTTLPVPQEFGFLSIEQEKDDF